jgi:hypothetical protein
MWSKKTKKAGSKPCETVSQETVHLVEKFGDLARKINENNGGTPIRVEKVPTDVGQITNQPTKKIRLKNSLI